MDYFSCFVITWLTVGVSCLVTFLAASIFVKKYYKGYVEDSAAATSGGPTTNINNINNNGSLNGPIRKIVVACDAGMGSSAMSASSLKKKLKEAGYKYRSCTHSLTKHSK